MQEPQPYETYRPLLLSLAYRMLGSVSDAEDIVQEVFLDYYQIDRKGIEHDKAYLAKMVTNRCLNEQQSARKRRETYVGNWLPEPDVIYSADGKDNPADRLEKYETITYAMLVMLENLSAIERAVFVLRETLAFDYADISDMTGKSEANCRKLLSRAKDKLGVLPNLPVFHNKRALELAGAFIRAAETGDTALLVGMLAEDAIMVSDGGGKVHAAIFPIMGRTRIVALYEGLARKGNQPSSQAYIPAWISGQSGLLLLQNGHPARVLTFQWDASGEKIERIYLVMNPDKLSHVTNADAILS
ncbi:RNA polymerase sigma factor SigJ [Paenibacillus paeoniae]|uniref:RNA polymerase sigma factor SigJ n=1 Tax=Paenibacillus paeoniae TaxID=2292705 RepID=A0A371P0N1_9BACL|nr:RNA polymerase sigma factor SigJ [Paenibacillus paeoniae]REK69493.1 RNA polymerase sigma factor SigJ [Paenibacillus paeoniae]